MIKCLSKAKDKVKNFVVENSVAFRRASIGAGATALVVGSSLVSFAADGATAPSIYAQQGKCRNHAAFSTLKTIKQPL